MMNMNYRENPKTATWRLVIEFEDKFGIIVMAEILNFP
jgi:hypothetical protein